MLPPDLTCTRIDSPHHPWPTCKPPRLTIQVAAYLRCMSKCFGNGYVDLFFWWGHVMRQQARESAACHTGLGPCRGLHPTGRGASGKMFYARTRLHGAVWDWRWADRPDGTICFVPGGVPTSCPLKTRDTCTICSGSLRCSWSIWSRCNIPFLSVEPFSRTGTRW